MLFKFEKKFLILVLMAGICFLPELLMAQRGVNLIGVADFRALVMLHPSMADYNPYYSAFRVDLTKVSQNQVMAVTQSQKNEIAALNAEIRALQASLTESRRKYERLNSDYEKDFTAKTANITATAALALESGKFRDRKRSNELKYNAEISNFTKRIAMQSERLSILERLVHKEGFTTIEETRKRMNGIMADVMSHIRAAATKRGVSVVLNSSHRRTIKRLAEKTKDKKKRAPADFRYAEVVFAPYRPLDSYESSQSDHGTKYVADYYDSITSGARNWLEFEETVLPMCDSAALDTEVLLGGIDLTADTLASIFKYYKINEHIGNAIIKAFTSND